MVKIYAANKQYLSMSEEEVWKFLDEKKTMIVATTSEGGDPHNTPVWYVVDRGKIYFRAQSYKVKIRNVTAHQAVSCVVEDGEKYVELRGVMIQGKARLLKDGSFARRINRMIVDRYAEERRVDRMPEHWRKARESESRSIVEVEPLRIASWDNRKWLS